MSYIMEFLAIFIVFCLVRKLYKKDRFPPNWLIMIVCITYVVLLAVKYFFNDYFYY
jgi:hypothetical protein